MNTDDYNHIKTLKEAKRIIAEQDMIIGSQFRELTSLKDTQRRLNDCNSKRKREAGYDQWVSFDVVWDETLKKAQAQALHIPVVVKSLPTKEIKDYLERQEDFYVDEDEIANRFYNAALNDVKYFIEKEEEKLK